MKKLFLFICLTFLTSGFAQNIPYTILISFDGFRWDYTNRGLTPNIELLKNEGVSSLSLQPVFPSKTFPNHYSIITGQYPQNHGIIANFFENPITGEKYSLGDTNAVRNPYWYWGEAFWETAERQGIKCASYFWPGSEVELDYRRPTYYEKYDHVRPYSTRIDGIINWLSLPFEKRPKFITLYFDAADTYGHRFGPNSKEIDFTIASLDSLIGNLVINLKKIEMYDSTNIILVSDHGMTEISKERFIDIDKILEGYNYKVDGNGPMVFINSENKEITQLYDFLKASEKNFKVYLKDEIPNHFKFSQNYLFGDIIMIADMGWSIMTNKDLENWGKYFNKGNHGYDNHHLDMHGYFIANGPSFKKNYKTGTLLNIDIYPLLCDIYKLTPKSNIDGKADRINFILKED
ncbi:MAG: ectonucleotide pyrophosphatase/phosphodiesterase [Ignavibacteria bacterium]|jgi:predicted AlkP superfamily pyrophosphatase or phosphodiesterase|nr:ectonucleotide pyrophosphatase/phosphodiesterase [Ignavibacteria bacterium]